MNGLFIDTTSNKEIIVRLTINGEDFEEKKQVMPRETQLALPMIIDLLKNHNLEINDLDEINVNPGPGSFTGIRVGLSFANTLGFLLNIPVNGILYSKEKKVIEGIYT